MASVNHRTVVTFEKGTRAPVVGTLDAIRRALERGGVEFTGDVAGVCGAGVRLRWRSVEPKRDGHTEDDDERRDLDEQIRLAEK